MGTGDNRSTLYYRLACTIAIVAVAFSVAVGMLMVASYLTMNAASPLDLVELDQLRASMKDNPADDAVKAKIRDLDFVARQFYFGGLHSLRTGSLLLLCGVVIAVASLKMAVVLRRRRTDPRDYPGSGSELESAATARFAIAAMAVALLTGALVAGLMERLRGGGGGTVPPQVVRVSSAEALTNWPGFRGVAASGVSAFTNLPVSWDVKTSNNILWKVKVPLPGMSSPVVWGNRVFLTGASDIKREVYCYDLDSGTCLWRAGVDAAPGSTNKAPKVNKDTGYAASTPVTDGSVIYSIFANGDVAAIDFCAREMWTATLGLPENRYGYSASLALYGGNVLVQYDMGGEKGRPSQLIALDTVSGKEVWGTVRPVVDSWPSPILADTESGPQLVTAANDHVIAYNPVSGAEIWRVQCGGSDVAATPVFAGGLVIAPVASDRIYAIRPNGRGDVTASHVAWRSENGISDVASPVSDGELVYLANSSGTLTCLDVKTGQVVWDKSLAAEFYASPGLAGDRIYLVSRSGEVFIIRAGRKYEEIGKAHLGEPSDCSPAFVNGRLLMRGLTHLFCIGQQSE